jgi:hypothetical protein
MVDVQEALPELDNLQGHKQGDGDQVGVQNPEGDHEDDPVDSSTLIVTLYMQISIPADSITTGSTCDVWTINVTISQTTGLTTI